MYLTFNITSLVASDGASKRRKCIFSAFLVRFPKLESRKRHNINRKELLCVRPFIKRYSPVAIHCRKST